MRFVRNYAVWFAMLSTLASTVLLPSRSASAQCQYETHTFVDELSNPELQQDIRITAMNDLGQVAGILRQRHPFVWSSETGLIELPLPTELNSLVVKASVPGMNNDVGKDGIGQIVVNFIDLPGVLYAGYLYDDGVWTRLSPDPAFRLLTAGINNSGQIAGKRLTANGNSLFRWEDGEFTDFDLAGASFSVLDVNEHGTVVGTVSPGVIFTWNGRELTVFDQLDSESIIEWPLTVNSFGRIAGDIYFAPDDAQNLPYAYQAFLVRDGETILFHVDGFPYSSLYALNDLDQVILEVLFDEHNDIHTSTRFWQKGAYWTFDELFGPLPQSPSIRPYVINNRGQMAGVYFIQEEFGAPHHGALGAIFTPINRPLGDVDCDCVVDGFDLSQVLSDWGHCAGVGFCRSDLVDSATFLPPGDGIVDGADLAVVLSNWGASTAVR